MMIGVAQVIGTKPTLNLLFSNLPVLSFTAALTLSRGIMLAIAAAKVPPPTKLMNSRRLRSL